MFYQNALILEGGGTRGVFTAGVLDAIMEHDIRFSYLIGVSAGACNMMNFASHQIGRSKQCMIDSLTYEKYVSLKKFFTGNSLFDLEYIFKDHPGQADIFDTNAYLHYPGRKIIVCTNCLTGRPYYFETDAQGNHLMEAGKASCSLPLISPIRKVGGIPLLDGGITDPVPFSKPIRDGLPNNVIILTRPKGYRKEVKKISHLYYAKYQKYPNLIKAMEKRTAHYNRQMDAIDELEQQENAFVIRPKEVLVGRTEQNPAKLTEFYMQGYQTGRDLIPDLQSFLSTTGE